MINEQINATQNSFGVYCIRLAEVGVYVGSAVNIRVRLKQHFRHLRCGNHHSRRLQSVYDKYGADSFNVSVLEIVDDKKNLVEREQFWIDGLNAHIGKGGFNMTPHAGSLLGNKHREETKQKIKQKLTGQLRSQEHRRNIAAAKIGKPLSVESIIKRSEKRKGQPRSPEASARAALSNTGKKRTPEARQRMSEAASRRRYGKRGKYNQDTSLHSC